MPDREQPITLEQFYKEEQSRILAFKMWWMKNHHINPEHFPLEMAPGEWDAQIINFDPMEA